MVHPKFELDNCLPTSEPREILSVSHYNLKQPCGNHERSGLFFLVLLHSSLTNSDSFLTCSLRVHSCKKYYHSEILFLLHSHHPGVNDNTHSRVAQKSKHQPFFFRCVASSLYKTLNTQDTIWFSLFLISTDTIFFTRIKDLSLSLSKK